MAGHLRKRGKSWELVAFTGRDGLSGKKRYVSLSMKGTKREAEAALARLATEIDDRHHGAASGTVGELSVVDADEPELGCFSRPSPFSSPPDCWLPAMAR